MEPKISPILYNMLARALYRTGIFVNEEFARMAGLHSEEMVARCEQSGL